ncbi:MAG: hypothetical protein ACHQIK_06070 [Candidatus Acidiferrales bacterium]
MEPTNISQSGTEKRRRLAPADQVALQPWRRATELTRCAVYWIGVRAFPVPIGQRTWILKFVTRLADHLREKAGLRQELFVQLKALNPSLRDTFVSRSTDWMPMTGLSRAPKALMPPPPSEADIKALQEGRKKFDANEYMPGYSYWLLDDAFQAQMEALFGAGATTVLFLRPDEKAQAPKLALPKELFQNPMFAGADPNSAIPLPSFVRDNPLMRQMNVESKINAAFKLQDEFLAKSKTIFGAGLEDHPAYRGFTFIIPELESKDFFQQPEQDVKSWFELFDVYLHESAPDQGILLAAREDIDAPVIEIVQKMKDEGLLYPNG